MELENACEVSKEDLEIWKKQVESERRSLQNQIVLSWCNLNVFGEDDKKSDSIWNKLSKYVNNNKTAAEKHILKNVSGAAYPGELLVIMGSSGAGKTTLLNCLTFRNLKDLQISGWICVNNQPVTQTELAAQSAYIQQDDLFIQYLTVKEHLIFQSLVRMCATTYEERLERVEEVMKELSLKKCEHVQIGLPGVAKGISGGERKRLALASQLLTNPALLFCDEPTTGLDSFMSLNVIQMLKDIATSGRTVITTLHVPSSEVFQFFDKLCLMCEGRTAFLGSREEASKFFAKLQFPCPKNYNPADHYIRVLSKMPGTDEESFKRRVFKLCDAFKASSLGVKIDKATKKSMIRLKKEDDLWSRKSWISTYKTSCVEQCKAIFWRSWLTIQRNPGSTSGKILLYLLESFLISAIYFGQRTDQLGIKNLNGITYYFLNSISFATVFSVIDTFCGELPLFIREYKDGLYRSDIYYISKITCDLPISITLACINTTVCYFAVGLDPTFDKFATALFISILVGQASQGMGYIISTIAPNIQLAAPLVSCFVPPLLTVGGYFLNLGSIPIYLQWYADLSWFKYGFEAYMINQWSDINNIECNNNSSLCMTKGIQILNSESISVGDFWPSILQMVVLAVAFRIVGYIILFYKASHKD